MLSASSFFMFTQGGGGTTYATWNPADMNTNIVLSNGNLTASNPSVGVWAIGRATIGKSAGKWYWEIIGGTNAVYDMVGVAYGTASIADDKYLGIDADGWGYFSNDGWRYHSGPTALFGATFTTGDVIGFALDVDAGTCDVYKNNSLQGTLATGLTGTVFPAFSLYTGSDLTVNFGATALTYTPPTGYNAGMYN
jgi:hypothetical protein